MDRDKPNEITQEAPSQDDFEFVDGLIEEASKIPDEAEMGPEDPPDPQQRGYR